MSLLSICIPSNRNLAASRAAIESALAFADAADATVILSDNSGDGDKRAHFEHLSDRLIYLSGAGSDAASNMMNTLCAVETPFLMPMGDDDELFFVDGEERIDLSRLPDDVVGIRPQTQIWTRQGGVRQTERFEIVGDRADGRILEYNQKSRGNNSIYYSVYRTAAFVPLMQLFDHAHPTRGGYCDWALCFALMACGKVLHDPSMLYRYDLGRWADKDSLENSKSTLFMQAGLPADSERFSALLTFADLHTFLLASKLPLSGASRQQALVMNCKIALATFIRRVKEEPQSFDETVQYLAQMIEENPDTDSAYQIAVMLMDSIHPGLKDGYIRFFQQATAA